MKALIYANALNAYPDYSKIFHLYIDASDFQLGTAIIQDRKIVSWHQSPITVR